MRLYFVEKGYPVYLHDINTLDRNKNCMFVYSWCLEIS